MRQRVLAAADGIVRTARRGDAVYQHMLQVGVADSLRAAAAELVRDAVSLATPSR